MFGLPADIDLTFLVGRTLLQVCFGLNDLVLNFDDRVSIQVSSCVGTRSKTGERRRDSDFRDAAPGLLSLVNEVVTRADGSSDGTLTLEFGGCGALTLYDDSKQFESYVIKAGERTIVV